jgi:patched 1 protein
VPDVGAELTGGCYGFAAKYMHWPEELLVGGAKHNKTGHLTRAAALQTVIQLMGEREVYDFWANTYKVHHIDWSQEKASQVLETWQRAFTKQVKMLQNSSESGPYNLYAFSTTTMNDILGKYSELSLLKVLVGCALVVSTAPTFRSPDSPTSRLFIITLLSLPLSSRRHPTPPHPSPTPRPNRSFAAQ